MITYRKLQDTIAGTVDGKPFNMAKTEENINFLDAAIKEENAGNDRISVEEILAFVKASRSNEVAMSNKYLIFMPATNEYFLTLDGKRHDKAVPKVLVDLIEKSYDKDIDFMPVVKAWARLLSNPRYSEAMGNYFATYLETMHVDESELTRLMEEEEYSSDAATALATYQDIAITQEGLLATYKVADIVTWEYMMELQDDKTYLKVKNDKLKKIPAVLDPTTGEELEPEKFQKPDTKEEFIFTPAICTSGHKFYSGDKIGYIYQIGKQQWLPEEAPRNLNNTFGGGGLYIGGLNYVAGYRSYGSHVLTCFANPGDIISFQDKGHAIRVDALMPNNVWDEDDSKLVGAYHSSEYGQLSEERLEELIAKAVEDGIDILASQTDSPNE
jgi:hypothetical protein